MNWMFIYRLLLRLYPKPFRVRFGGEMLDTFEQGWASSSNKVFFVISEILDLTSSALKERITLLSTLQVISVVVVVGLGLALGLADTTAREVQGTVLLSLVAGSLIGSLWPRRAFRVAGAFALGLPVAYVMKGHSLSDAMQTTVDLVPTFIGVTVGAAVRYLLRLDYKLLPFGVAVACGLAFGMADFVLPYSSLIGLAVFLAGLGLGRIQGKKALAPSLLLGFSTTLGTVCLMANHIHPARPHYIFVDLRNCLVALIGMTVGCHLPEVTAESVLNLE